MDTLGKKLKAARQKRKLTASEAAKGTRIKVQHIEAIENDDFSSIAAPTYAKGFIRIYAEFLGLNPEPLIEEYTAVHLPPPRASLIPDDSPKATPPRRERKPFVWPKCPKIKWPTMRVPPQLKELWNRIRGIRIKPSPEQIRMGLAGLAALLVIMIGIVGIRNLRTRETTEQPVTGRPETVRGSVESVPPRPGLPMIEALPEPYLE